MPRPVRSTAQILRANTTIPPGSRGDPSLCWLWTGFCDGRYGRLYDSSTRRNLLAHRASYEAAYGPIPPAMVVRHSCDVKLCVRPGHLALGTQADNIRDSVERGQMQRGSRNGKAKLTEDDVRAMRRASAAGARAHDLADEYGVGVSNVWAILSGQTWTHV